MSERREALVNRGEEQVISWFQVITRYVSAF